MSETKASYEADFRAAQERGVAKSMAIVAEVEQQVARRMAALDALAEYTEARRELEDYRAAYSLVVETLDALAAMVSARENRLKEAVRAADEPVSNDEFTTTIQKRFSRTIDGKRLVQAEPWLRDVPGAVQLVTTVSEPIIKALVKAGTLAQELVDSVTEAKALTAAVSVKRMGASPVTGPDPRD